RCGRLRLGQILVESDGLKVPTPRSPPVHGGSATRRNIMRFLGLAVVAAALAALTIDPTSAAKAKEDVDLKVGDKAPEFEATDDQGKAFKSSDVVGKKILVVYFYPADCTGGCTKQACGFRDDADKLADKGVVVVGVSGDSVKNHQVFKKVHKLNFT